jgi:hypothetical protein
MNWLRRSAFDWTGGETVTHHPESQRALTALAAWAGGAKIESISVGSPVITDKGKAMLLIADGKWPSELRREAQRRAAEGRSAGRYAPDEDVEFICSGELGTLPVEIVGGDVAGDAVEGDVLDGQLAGVIRLRSANDLIGAA